MSRERVMCLSCTPRNIYVEIVASELETRTVELFLACKSSFMSFILFRFV